MDTAFYVSGADSTRNSSTSQSPQKVQLLRAAQLNLMVAAEPRDELCKPLLDRGLGLEVNEFFQC